MNQEQWVVHEEGVIHDDAFEKQAHEAGFFSIKIRVVKGKPYCEVTATFICDKCGFIEIKDFFSSATLMSHTGAINRLARQKHNYFKWRKQWEKAYADDTREESKTESREDTKRDGVLPFLSCDWRVRG